MAPVYDFKYFHYNPSKIIAIIFVVQFGFSTMGHAFHLLRKRTWYFIPFLIGCFFETIGYIGRAIAAGQSPNWTIGPYVMQSILILLAPAFFAASIYMVLGRIILLTDGERHSLIRARWLTKIFVLGDVLSFLAQSAGGVILAKAKTMSDVKLGNNVITAGLAVQVLFFGLFIFVASTFHYRMNAVPTTRSLSITIPWRRYLMTLYVASGLIMIRSMFRIIEYAMGQDGFLLRKEIFMFVFDSTLMFLVTVLFNLWHPSALTSKAGLVESGVVEAYRLPDQRLSEQRLSEQSLSEQGLSEQRSPVATKEQTRPNVRY